MANFLKNLFFKKKILSDNDLVDIWESSKKNLKDYEDFILRISDEKKFEYLMKEMENLELKNLYDINELNKTITFKFISIPKTTKNQRKLNNFLNQLEFCRNLFSLIGEEKFEKEFLFQSKYKNLLMIEEKFDLESEDLMKFIYEYYLIKEDYLKCLEFTMMKIKTGSSLYVLILPNQKNFHFISPEFFSTKFQYQNFSELFKDKNLLAEKDLIVAKNVSILDYYINIIIYFSQKEDKYIKSIMIHLKNNFTEEYTLISTIYNFYILYTKIFNLSIRNEKLKNFKTFCSQGVFKSFNQKLISSLSKSSSETFNLLIEDFISIYKFLLTIFIEKEQMIIRKDIEMMPKIILNQLLVDRAPIKMISSYINLIYNTIIGDKNFLINHVIKFYIENFSDSLQNNLLILEMLELNKSLFQCEDIFSDLSRHIGLIKLLDSYRIKVSLNDLIISDYKISISASSYKSTVLYKYINEFFQNISRKNKFIDKNLNSIIYLKAYLEKYSIQINESIIEFSKSNNMSKNAVRILLENVYFNDLNSKDIEKFLNLFIECKNNLKENEIEDYLQDITEVLSTYKDKIDKTYEHKLRNLFRFFKINQVFHNNQIDIEILKEYNFEHLNLNLNSILEIFLFKKFNIDHVESLVIFIDRTKDIYKALDLNKYEYLFILFNIFFKYQKEKIYIEILNFFIDDTSGAGFEYFEKCISVIKKNPSLNMNNFLNQHNFKIKLIENSENFNFFEKNEEIIENINFFKSGLLSSNFNKKFNLDNEDFLTKLNLKDNYEKYNQLIRNDEYFRDDVKSNFFLFMQNLNEISENDKKNSNTNKINLKYSFHPKMKVILDKYNLDLKGKEFKFKCAVYRLLLRKRDIDSIEEILDIENLTIQNIEKFDHYLNLFKFLINLYEGFNLDKFLNIIDLLKANQNQSYFNIDHSQISQELFFYNMHHFKYFNVYNLELHNKILNLNIFPECEHQNIFKLIAKITRNKFNVLPFTSNFKNLLENQKINESIVSHYNEVNLNVNYFNQNLFMGGLSKTYKDIDLEMLQNKLQVIEVYNNLNINNYFNFSKLFTISPVYFHSFDNINLLFIIKLVSNITNYICVNLNYVAAIKEIINFMKAFQFPEDQVKYICYEIFYLPNLNYIIESHHKVLIFEKNLSSLVKDLLNSKLILFDEIFLNFSFIISKSYLITDKLKIFKIKNCIIQNTAENEIKNMYENIQHQNEFYKLKSLAGSNQKLKNEIEKIYTAY